MEPIEKLLAKVEVLPMSPTLLPKLLPKLSDVDSNFAEIVELIAYEPALTAKLLQICNSAFFGLETDVGSVSEAVNRVGYQSVYLLVAMINGSGCFPTTLPPPLDATKIWQHSVATAFNSKFIAESAGVDGNLLFTAGLLHDVGKAILAQEQPASAALLAAPGDAASLEKEKAAFGFTHPEVGEALMTRWNLPAQISAAVGHHHHPKAAGEFARAAACVALGNLVSHSQEQPKILERAEFKEWMTLLNQSDENLKRWNERLRDHQSLVSGMSRLPI